MNSRCRIEPLRVDPLSMFVSGAFFTFILFPRKYDGSHRTYRCVCRGRLRRCLRGESDLSRVSSAIDQPDRYLTALLDLGHCATMMRTSNDDDVSSRTTILVAMQYSSMVSLDDAHPLTAIPLVDPSVNRWCSGNDPMTIAAPVLLQ